MGGPGSGYRHININEKEVLRLYDEGYSSHTIGRRLGCAHMTILNILARNDVPRRSKSKALKLRRAMQCTTHTHASV